jgi:GrpB-like predicted nucleotidyltransferase (UPF0157 family)
MQKARGITSGLSGLGPMPLTRNRWANEMTGLKRHTVHVVDHQPRWAGLGAEACQKVKEVCGHLIVDVQHVGSTAVPRLPAKPILDLAAAVTTHAAIPELVEKLAGVGYIYRGDRADAGGHLFVWGPEPDVRAVHLHVVEVKDPQWRNYIRFRDTLRENPILRKRYGELKKKLKSTYPDDRESYTKSKHEFIQRVLNMEAQQEP